MIPRRDAARNVQLHPQPPTCIICGDLGEDRGFIDSRVSPSCSAHFLYRVLGSPGGASHERCLRCAPLYSVCATGSLRISQNLHRHTHSYLPRVPTSAHPRRSAVLGALPAQARARSQPPAADEHATPERVPSGMQPARWGAGGHMGVLCQVPERVCCEGGIGCGIRGHGNNSSWTSKGSQS